MRRAEAPRTAADPFRRCHNFIHGNEGMPKDAAFWQFLYLIFAKMYDEQRKRGTASSGRIPRPSRRRSVRTGAVKPLFEP